MNENSPIAGLTDSQQAVLLRALLSHNDREDITIKNLSGGTLSSVDLIAKLKTATGVKPLPRVSPPRHSDVVMVADLHLGSRPAAFRPLPNLIEPEQDWSKLLNLTSFFESPFRSELTMKPASQCHGWATGMRKLGYKVSSRSVHFGHQEHTLVKNDITVTLVQGGTVPVKSKFLWGSVSPGLLNDLRSVGVLAETKVRELEPA